LRPWIAAAMPHAPGHPTLLRFQNCALANAGGQRAVIPAQARGLGAAGRRSSHSSPGGLWLHRACGAAAPRRSAAPEGCPRLPRLRGGFWRGLGPEGVPLPLLLCLLSIPVAAVRLVTRHGSHEARLAHMRPATPSDMPLPETCHSLRHATP